MARPAGQVVVRMDVGQIEEASGRAMDKAAKQVAEELSAYIQTQITKKQSLPASKPGQYPHVGEKYDHRKLYEGYTVTGTRHGLKVYSQVPHGRYLEEKSPSDGGRPWATRAMESRDWMARIAKLAWEYTGGSRRGSK